ncbi:DUF192 domain-containing protein [Haloarchaeobius amylolyticus]|uniref:DUF192 domain-containing protein n=1 Tax=Haloarchaeobius amylolyticus TaxID=1198296 RepID=UPI002270CA8B|nr:DUF192 domain-containing protein [Haloarchaeobius amylolyticus]
MATVDRERAFNLALAGVFVLLAGFLLYYAGIVELPGQDQHDTGTAVVTDENGTRLATISVEVADTRQEQYTGLSDHETLANGSGMWFVYDQERQMTFVMRKMDFPLDIIFVDSDGRITSIHHMRAPGPNEDGNDIKAPGRGQYVLEVPRGYTNATGIEVGDHVEVSYD